MHLRYFAAASVVAALGLFGCGHSEEEWQMQLDKYNKLLAEKTSNEKSAAEKQAQLEQQLAEEAAKVSTKLVQSHSKDRHPPTPTRTFPGFTR